MADFMATSLSQEPPQEPPQDPQLQCTLAEVALHNSRSDKWIAIRGRIFDVTAFLSSHPGGLETILEAPTNATVAFEAVGHSLAALKELEKYIIGQIKDYDPESDGPPPTDAAGGCNMS